MKFFRNVPDTFRSDNIREKNFSVTHNVGNANFYSVLDVIHFYISYNLSLKIMVAFDIKDIYYFNFKIYLITRQYAENISILFLYHMK